VGGRRRRGMKVAFTCPTCGGQKTVQKPPWVAGDQQTWVSGDTTLYPCPSCNGSGILWEEMEIIETILSSIYKERENIIAAFIAQYQCKPDEVEQVFEYTGNTIKWSIRKKSVT
jgi:hypothetical protein